MGGLEGHSDSPFISHLFLPVPLHFYLPAEWCSLLPKSQGKHMIPRHSNKVKPLLSVSPITLFLHDPFQILAEGTLVSTT